MCVSKRYLDLMNLHGQLERDKSIADRLPPFPSKSISTKDVKALKTWKKKLESYLKELFSHTCLLNNPTIVSYFKLRSFAHDILFQPPIPAIMFSFNDWFSKNIHPVFTEYCPTRNVLIVCLNGFNHSVVQVFDAYVLDWSTKVSSGS